MGYGESMEEDDMVIRVGNSLYRERRTDKGGRVTSPRSL
jgi:6-phosphogluconate dehydrogenase (decarboxylating)